LFEEPSLSWCGGFVLDEIFLSEKEIKKLLKVNSS